MKQRRRAGQARLDGLGPLLFHFLPKGFDLRQDADATLPAVLLVITYFSDGATGPANRFSRGFLSIFWRIGRIGGDHVDPWQAQATCHYNRFSRTAWCEADCMGFDDRVGNACLRTARSGHVLVSSPFCPWPGIHDLALA